MDKPENRRNSKIKLYRIISVIALITCSFVITSFFTVKNFSPTLPNTTSTPVYVLASNTPKLPISIQAELSATSFAIPSPAITPAQLKITQIETNLLQNSGFENGLSGWIHSDNSGGVSIYETAGVNGKGFCSRRYLPNIHTDGMMAGYANKEWTGFVQEVPVELNQTYYFSGWVKANKAISVYASAQYYDGSEFLGWASSTSLQGVPSDGITTTGWFLITGNISVYLPGTNHVLIGLWHGLILNAPNDVDSTICVDDLVFGKIIE